MIRYMKMGLLIFMLLIVPRVLFAQYPVFGDERRPKGKVISFTERCYETTQGAPVLVSKNKFTYDQKGVLIERIIYDTIDSTKTEQKVVYVYEDGELYEEVGENYKIRYAYDDNGKKLAEKYSSINVNHLKRFDYNMNGQLIKSTNYNSKGKLLYTETFKYDDQKTLLMFFHTVPDSTSKSFQAIYTKDAKGKRLSERVYATTGYILYSKQFEYDQEGQLAAEIHYNYAGAYDFTSKFKYSYDQVGNWISLVNKNKASSYLTTRVIEYSSDMVKKQR